MSAGNPISPLQESRLAGGFFVASIIYRSDAVRNQFDSTSSQDEHFYAPGMPSATDWVTQSEVEIAVLDLLKQSTDTWRDEDRDRLSAAVSVGLRLAWQDLIPILLNRGYTLVQLEKWDGRTSVLTDQAIFRTLTRYTALNQIVTDEKIKEFDWRETLKSPTWVPMSSDGVALVPGSGETSSQGVETDGNPGPDLFGNGAFAVGRLGQNGWVVKRNTVF